MKEYRVVARADETYYVYAENEKDAIDAASQTDYARRDVEYDIVGVREVELEELKKVK